MLAARPRSSLEAKNRIRIMNLPVSNVVSMFVAA
jgi:hypothetical protein